VLEQDIGVLTYRHLDELVACDDERFGGKTVMLSSSLFALRTSISLRYEVSQILRAGLARAKIVTLEVQASRDPVTAACLTGT
jgi:hypothetical protein